MADYYKHHQDIYPYDTGWNLGGTDTYLCADCLGLHHTRDEQANAIECEEPPAVCDECGRRFPAVLTREEALEIKADKEYHRLAEEGLLREAGLR